MGRFGNSWELMKVSLGVIKKDQEILLFPFFSGIAMIAISITFIMGIFYTGLFVTSSALVVVLFFLLYLILYFIGIYFNVAIIGCATIRLQGDDPTVKDGFRIANENIKGIFTWALVAATVGLILRALEEKVGTLGKIAVSFVGFAWTMATFFVIPVMIYEKLSVFKAIRRSAHVFRDTWGETFISQFGFGIIFFLAGFLGIIPIVLGLFAGGIFIWIGLSVAIAYFIFLFCLSTAAQGVLTAALYRYATTGQIGVLPENLVGARQPQAFQSPPHPIYQTHTTSYNPELDYMAPPAKEEKAVPVGYIKCPACGTVNPQREKQCRTCAGFLK